MVSSSIEPFTGSDIGGNLFDRYSVVELTYSVVAYVELLPIVVQLVWKLTQDFVSSNERCFVLAAKQAFWFFDRAN